MKSRGYTLIEIVLVIIIIGILTSVALRSLQSTDENQRFNETVAETEMLARGIVGDERLVSGGSRTDFGYFGDVGALPPNLDALVTNPGGYATWNGPYIRSDFVENTEDYKRDAWNNLYTYSGGVTISSTGGGSSMTKQFANSTSSLTSNTIYGIVRDKTGCPPSDSASNVNITIQYPNGAGSMTSSTVSPSRSGEFSFSNSIPIGLHLIRAVVTGVDDTTAKYVAINPASTILTELRFPSDLWGGTGGGGGGSSLEILRPSGTGSSTTLSGTGCAANWQCVDEVTSDEDGSYVVGAGGSWDNDLYAAEDHSIGSGTIDSVLIYFRGKDNRAQTAIKTNGILYEGGGIWLTASYDDYSTTYATNPQTLSPWTWAEIDALEIGVTIKDSGRCTQVWVEVHFTP